MRGLMRGQEALETCGMQDPVSLGHVSGRVFWAKRGNGVKFYYRVVSGPGLVFYSIFRTCLYTALI